MEYLLGVGLGLATCLLATFTGFDRDRAFYPTITFVIATYYALFAVMARALQALVPESLAIAGFLLLSILGFKRNLWVVVAALAAHGAFDSIHGQVVANPGVPTWWPGFCLTFDITVAGYLALLMIRDGRSARPTAHR